MAAAEPTPDATPELGGIAGWAISVIDALGGLGAASLIALENLFPPLPSEIILPLTGFSAGAGAGFTLLGAILWCTAGSLVGAFVLYMLGALLGRERTRKILNSLPLVNPTDVVKTEAFFDKHGSWTVFFGRMIPIFRSLISLPAGVTRMNLLRFTFLTAAGSLIWNSILIYAGYALGANWHIVENYVGVLSKVVIAIVVAALVLWIVLRVRKNRREKEAGAGGEHLSELDLEPRSAAPGESSTPASPTADSPTSASPTTAPAPSTNLTSTNLTGEGSPADSLPTSPGTSSREREQREDRPVSPDSPDSPGPGTNPSPDPKSF
ncbi:VTT domain-containing protein [Actinomycetaceae bacterium L2_0104]